MSDESKQDREFFNYLHVGSMDVFIKTIAEALSSNGLHESAVKTAQVSGILQASAAPLNTMAECPADVRDAVFGIYEYWGSELDFDMPYFFRELEAGITEQISRATDAQLKRWRGDK